MPLLTSPIDGSPMKQVTRYGIEIDICPATGGVWLDKGELEKLMAVIRDTAVQEQVNVQQKPQKNYAQQDKKKRGGGVMDMLEDIFDF